MYSDERSFTIQRWEYNSRWKYIRAEKIGFFPPFLSLYFHSTRPGGSRLLAPLFRALASTISPSMPSTHRIFEDPRREKTLSRIKPQVFIAAVFKNHALNAKYAPSGLENVLYRYARELRVKKNLERTNNSFIRVQFGRAGGIFSFESFIGNFTGGESAESDMTNFLRR